MTYTLLNNAWSFRAKTTAFQELSGADESPWVDVTLPHDALIGTARTATAPHGETSGYFEGGVFEYKHTLTVPEEWRGSLVALEFDGVYRDAGVTVNGAYAGQHAFGYSRFIVPVDPFLTFGSDNEIRVDCRTHVDSRWYTGAGIYRDVRLIVKPATRIAVDGVTLTTPDVDADRAVVVADVTVQNSSPVAATTRLVTRIVDSAGVVVAERTSPVTLLPGEDARLHERVIVRTPRLWSAEDPTLYTAHVELRSEDALLDSEEVSFGIRELQLDPLHGLRINGTVVKLRGACIHADNGPLGAAAIRGAEERKIRLLKEAGFNAIRSSHHPASAALLDACDRLGMLVIDEAFDMWTSGKSHYDYAHDFPQWWERDLEAMVARDRNHPSVIFYSIGNEIPETGDRFGARWGRCLAQKLRDLDSTRYVTNGINGFVSVLDTVLQGMKARRNAEPSDAGSAAAGGVNQMMTDFGQMMDGIQASPMVTARLEESYSVLDAAGMNYGTARYELDASERPDRLIIGSETYVSQIDRNWALVAQHPQILGDFAWTGLDYLGETGIGLVQYSDGTDSAKASFSSGYPGLTAWCGDLDITGHRRTQSYYREIVFGLRAEPYIAVERPNRYDAQVTVRTPWSWSDTVSSWSWPGHENDPIRVEVYADADEVTLSVDGTPVATSPVGTERAFRADFDIQYRAGELTAVALRAGQEIGRTSLRTAATEQRLTLRANRWEISPGSQDLAFIEIELTDSDGLVHTTSDLPVTVKVDGPAVLAALGSANPVTEEGFSSATHQTFDGRALAIVRPTGPGRVQVTVTADDFTSSSVEITSR